MRRTVAFAVAAALSLTLVFAARPAPPADADTTDVVVVGCEYLAPGIDGFLDNETFFGDYLNTCTSPFDSNESLGIRRAYGTAFELTPSDLTDFETKGDRQLPEECTSARALCTLLVAVFLDDEGPVTLDLPPGLQSVQGGSADFVCDTEAEDWDCGTTQPNNGDGVVFFHVFNQSLAGGTDAVIRVTQEGVEQTASIHITGELASVELELSEGKVQTSGADAAGVEACLAAADYRSAGLVSHPSTTLARTSVRDVHGRDLARYAIYLESEDASKAGIGIDAPQFNLFNNSGWTEVGADGVWMYFAVCGGFERGSTQVAASVNTGDDEIRVVRPLTVVGVPGVINLAAAPPSVICNGLATSSVSAIVTDADGVTVADNVAVRFDVFAVGVASPIGALTLNGGAGTSVRGLSAYTQALVVFVTAKRSADWPTADVQRSIFITCTGFDTDGDGMPNTFEAGKFCLNAIVSDSYVDQDFDGLLSLNEYQLGTDPCDSDTDNDRCSDGAERGTAHENGGDRNPLDAWDFYDVNADAVIDLSDALAILGLFGTGVTDVGYLPAYDRYSPLPAKPWRTAYAVDGAGIDLTDALVNLASFGDDCS